MKEIIFATHNQHKLEEVQTILKKEYNVIGLNSLNFDEEIEETGTTLEKNAQLKAETIFNKFQINCFADDSGLEIEALNGEPGIFSARYAGEPADSQKNMQKVLDKMQNISNRKAKFRTVIAYKTKEKILFFEGSVEGQILTEKRGNGGFGYDPIFMPKGYDKSFAELSSEEKNRISHRAIAIKKFINYIKTL
ncbi:MAG: non-canonical purine NTP pyrophosphatase, RdgB/HAM1 family [Paludibacter sp.]|nr:MAG: non-canonical purine NTP pyrophosphatase, RdgB/HAM1 family [Paludibacter sp.]